MPRAGESVQTRSGRRLTLTSMLGCGGQGAVYRTDDPACAVKVRWRGDDSAAWQRRIERVAFLKRELAKLPGVNRFVLPRELLGQPWLGYEMPLLPSAQSVADLIRLPHEQPELAYLQSGGIKRRLGVAVRCARALAALHTAGFVFGDLSASNVLTASDQARSSVRLIDCDNIDIAGADGSGILGTPGYWAPELVQHRARPDAATDDHSLAVLMHELVYLAHPLRGDVLLEKDPDEAEALLLRGDLPWVFDPQDASNRTSAGIPLALTAAEDTTLFARFREAFGAGLRDRTRRPSAASLHEAAERLLRLCFDCPSCRGSQLYRKQRECAWCGTPMAPPLLLLIEPDGDAPEFEEMKRARTTTEAARKLRELGAAQAPLRGFRYRNCVVEDGLVLTDVLLRPWRSDESEEVPLLRVELVGDLVLLHIEKECGLLQGGRPVAAGETVRLKPGDSLCLPGKSGAPSCRLRLVRPRREEA